MINVLLAYGLSAGASWLLGFPARSLLEKRGVIDRPNARSSHSAPTVRGGGLAIVAVLLTGMVFFAVTRKTSGLLMVSAAVCLLAAVSFLDDLRTLNPGIRFLCHLTVAVLALSAMDWPDLRIALDSEKSITVPRALSVLLLLLWIVGYTNAFNFMDGINGLAASEAVLTAAGSVLLTGLAIGAWSATSVLILAIVAGAASGFLPHNFPKARMFLGDAGSASLGFLLAALAVWVSQTHGWWLFIPLVLLHANFVLDAGITLLRRVLRGERWYEAHREHFYQRLAGRGKSHAFVTCLYMTAQIIVTGLTLCYLVSSWPVRLLLIGVVCTLWLCIFGYCGQDCDLARKSLSAGTSSDQPVKMSK